MKDLDEGALLAIVVLIIISMAMLIFSLTETKGETK